VEPPHDRIGNDEPPCPDAVTIEQRAEFVRESLADD
jgi:hypothetical protein